MATHTPRAPEAVLFVFVNINVNISRRRVVYLSPNVL